MTDKLRYFIYARKSTDEKDRQVSSITAQLQELRRIAERDGLEIIEEITESQSAKQPGRPIFNRMLRDISAGKAHGIVTWKIDRLARNPVDEGQIKWLLQQGQIHHIRTADRDYYPGDNVVVLGVDFGVATQFIIDLKANVKRGMRYKVEKGWLPGLAPMGYINRQIRKGEHDIIPDPERFDLIKRLWQDLIEHHWPLREVYKVAMGKMGLRSRSGKKLSLSKFYKMFTNPFYYGYFRFGGNLNKGSHIPMITKQEFDLAQDIIHDRHRPRKQTHVIAFTGLMRCGECGSMLTADEKIKRNKKGGQHRYVYYRCTKSQNRSCKQRPISEPEIDRQIISLLSQIEISDGMREAIIEVLNKENAEQGQYLQQLMKSREKEYQKCVTSLNNLLRMHVRGDVSEEEFQPLRRELQEEKARLQGMLQDTSQQVDSWLARIDVLLTFAAVSKGAYGKADPEMKKQILLSLGENIIVKDGILDLAKNGVLFGVREISNVEKRGKRPIEPAKLLEKQALREIVTKWSG